jgi:hypothetical protein
MDLMIPILSDFVRTYWWLAASITIGLAVILSGLAAPVAIWLEDTYSAWAAAAVAGTASLTHRAADPALVEPAAPAVRSAHGASRAGVRT